MALQALRSALTRITRQNTLQTRQLEKLTVPNLFCQQERSKKYYRFCLSHWTKPNPPGGFGGRHPRFGLNRHRPAPRSQYIFKVLWPEDRKYTYEALDTHRLGGTDRETGRKVVRRGGGLRRMYYWVDTLRAANEDGSPMVERVIKLVKDDCHTNFLALVGNGVKLRNIFSTDGMQPGQLIRSYGDIPVIPVRPREGDSHPLGALPVGTRVCQLEPGPGRGAFWCTAAGTSGTILSKADGRVLVAMPNKSKFSFVQECVAVVGRCGNPDQNKIKFKSPNEKRWAGYRPRSGLWHRKDGYCGRKIKREREPCIINPVKEKKEVETLTFSLKLHDQRDDDYNGACYFV